jgi:thiamine-phosphate pyrophosphorylase
MEARNEIGQLQYITQTIPGQTHLDMVEAVCQAGCKWVQLRLKETSSIKVLDQAIKAVEICRANGAKIIINDYPHEALVAYADGVHLGKEDMDPERARDLLGDDMIIGGTANSFRDIERLLKADIDYIGLGPFRYTETKKKLAPVLGAEGYQSIMLKLNLRLKEHSKTIPVIAIGGILSKDVDEILATGVHGIAISGLITRSLRKKELITSLTKRISEFPKLKKYGVT